jgi:hypothetical protein
MRSDDAHSIQNLERVTRECLDNETVHRLFVSCQICNVNLKIDAAITETINRYKYAMHVPEFPSIWGGSAGSSVLSVVLCDTILSCFGCSDLDAKLLETILHDLCCE